MQPTECSPLSAAPAPRWQIPLLTPKVGPPTSELVKIVVYDGEPRAAKDPVGTCQVQLGDIEQSRDDGPVHFVRFKHPTWLNLYGAPKHVESRGRCVVGKN